MRTVAMGLAFATALATAACARLQAQAREEPPRPTPPAEAPAPEPAAPDPMAPALLERHNRERAEAKKPPLALDAKLSAAARIHARDMAEHGKMAHEGSDGSKPAERIKRQGYHYRRVGENVAYGQPTAARVMQGWMNSPHHRDNILGDFAEMGAARVEDAQGTPYWCVTFGTPWPRPDPARASAALVEAINAARAEAKKPPLEPDATLEDAAGHLARAMAAQGR
ncbi:MAG TPA: CAP domain-containing protein, partial [Isosphaeraceae bacterium]